ncbi:MAG: tyrosine-type recombinase/integrase [Lachnospiraceae bacterium]|nr:tyrosine-type recombinase/integrase [Lachnospiraceae bacterium]
MSRRGENIYKRKDGRWEGRLRNPDTLTGTGRYRSVYGKSYKEVKEKMLLFKQEQRRKTDNYTLQEAAMLWMESRKNYWKPGTYAAYEQLLIKYIIPYFGEISIEQINNQKMEQFISEINGTEHFLSQNYLFQICGVVRRILLYMNKTYDSAVTIPNNPVEKWHTQPKIMPLDKSMNRLEQYLLDNCQDDTCLGILIAFHTGIRIGELSALMWKDINMEEEIIYIRRNLIRVKEKNATQVITQDPKTLDSCRVIPIPPKLVPVLRKYQKEDSLYVVSGTKYLWAEPRTIQYRFKSILKKCDIEYFNFHMLRHAFATRCVEMGLDIKSLSEILGHSNIQMTLNLYVHPTMQQKKELMSRYDALFS